MAHTVSFLSQLLCRPVAFFGRHLKVLASPTTCSLHCNLGLIFIASSSGFLCLLLGCQPCYTLPSISNSLEPQCKIHDFSSFASFMPEKAVAHRWCRSYCLSDHSLNSFCMLTLGKTSLGNFGRSGDPSASFLFPLGSLLFNELGFSQNGASSIWNIVLMIPFVLSWCKAPGFSMVLSSLTAEVSMPIYCHVKQINS